ncbi:MAG: IS21-like element helper ATPase IstB [Turicibacter sp.]|nr:IS21-like element helper ATPase IstB [Turicibacter sp.]
MQRQQDDPLVRGLSFEDRFGLLIDAEYARRQNNKIANLIRKAHFQDKGACLEDIKYFPDRNLNKTEIASLSSGVYLEEKRNIIILGATGAGKSFLAQGLGLSACRKGKKVRYIRLPELLVDFSIARGEGTYQKLMSEYKKYDLIILDEWLFHPLSDNEATDLLEIIQARYQNGSIIFCSQIATGGWVDKLGAVNVAEAIIDRILHNSYEIRIEGQESMRKRTGIKS